MKERKRGKIKKEEEKVVSFDFRTRKPGPLRLPGEQRNGSASPVYTHFRLAPELRDLDPRILDQGAYVLDLDLEWLVIPVSSFSRHVSHEKERTNTVLSDFFLYLSKFLSSFRQISSLLHCTVEQFLEFIFLF